MNGAVQNYPYLRVFVVFFWQTLTNARNDQHRQKQFILQYPMFGFLEPQAAIDDPIYCLSYHLKQLD